MDSNKSTVPPSVLVLGNKPFNHLPLNSIIDSFDYICRCNLSFPTLNNGTKTDVLYLCPHLHDRLVVNLLPKDAFLKNYEKYYKKEYAGKFYDYFPRYNKCLIERVTNNSPRFNNFLKSKKCPYSFSKLPRTGYVAIIDFLLKGYKVFVSHFSIEDETRASFYIKPSWFETEHHSKTDELKILQWLHLHNHIDASLCLLEDSPSVSIKESNLSISPEIQSKLNKYL